MRKRDRELLKQRERSFNNSYHINQVALPQYNPLQDRYLAGFLENPRIRKQLISTGLIKFQRKNTSRPKTSQIKILTDNEKMRLPNIQDMLLQHNISERDRQRDSNPQSQSYRLYPIRSHHGELNFRMRNINNSHQFNRKENHDKILSPRNIGTSHSMRRRRSQINKRHQKEFAF